VNSATEIQLIGYSDRLSVAPGETIGFHVSSRSERYDARLVRLVHGDDSPGGPGFKEVEIPSAFDGEHTGHEQGFASGSCVLVDDSAPLRFDASFTLEAWVQPTLPGARPQAIITKGSSYGLVLSEDGAAELRVNDVRITTPAPLRPHTWYRVRGTYDAERGLARVEQAPLRTWPGIAGVAVAEGPAAAPASSNAALALAARDHDGQLRDHFNGRIDSPRVFARALAPGEDGTCPLAAWDLALTGRPAHRVTDAGPLGLHGRCVNIPLRAVAGHRWTGEKPDFRAAPEQYSAIHFHEDDLEDAGWDMAFELAVPTALLSGVYAARLRAGSSEDHVPFIVRPPRGRSASSIAVLVPTLSYLAYGSEHVLLSNPTLPVLDHQTEPAALDWYAYDHRLRSLYDRHSDGTGVAVTSRLRPITNLRPKYLSPSIGAAHQFSADLHLVDWLETQGQRADFITDEDLHAEGDDLLAPYRVVLTGSHPEYWTTAMLDALEMFLQRGGRLMYLGGNGLYWVTAIDPDRPHIVEVRRGQRGTGTWRSPVGENHLQSTGELGGLWLERGRQPRRHVGVGMTAQGFDRSLPYRREAGGFDSRASWIFDGVGDDAPIGADGLCLGGAAGFEIDRMDYAAETPPHALLLASATGFSDSYQHVVEEVQVSDSRQGGSVCPLVRADMVFFETPNDGAVFSTGSIAWCGGLSHNGYDNEVSRITGNVLRVFSSTLPLAEAIVAARSTASDA
jgi:N,N-dimethylformamidase